MKKMRGGIIVLAGMVFCLTFSTYALSAREVQVDVLWAGGQGEWARGGTSSAIIGVENNPRKTIRVGFYEEVAGGSGIMWRTSGWMATSVTSLLLGIDISNYKVSFDVGGRLDGPSAGGLLTIALIANLFGDNIKPDVAMTEQINPDGTIGPVGGIPQKIEGAVRKGKKLILVPYGQRSNVDLKTNQLVDVVERGKTLGADVREVSHISEAYPLLTGKPLPQAKPASDLTPELPRNAQVKVQNQAKMLLNKYSALSSKVKAAGQLTDELTQVMAQAVRAHSHAVKAFNQGLFAVAYDRMANANLLVETVLMGLEIRRIVKEGRDQGLKNYFDSLKTVVGKIDGFVKRLDMESPRYLSDAAALSEAYGMATQAKGSLFLGITREMEMEEIIKAAIEKSKKTPPPSQPGQPIKKPQLGVQVTDTQYGVMVNGIMSGSPAERAGLLVGDLLLQYNGYPVPNTQALLQLIGATRAGEPIRLQIFRGGNYIQLTAMLEGGTTSSPTGQPSIDAKTWEEVGKKMFEAAFFYKAADYLTDLAEDRLVVGMGFSGVSLPSKEVIAQWGRLLKTSADAVMNYFDGVFVQQGANQLGMSLEGFRSAFMSQEIEYALTHATHLALNNLNISESPYATLGPSMFLFSGASSILAKYDSVGVEMDKYGAVKKVKSEKALVNMLDMGFKSARESINLAKQNNVEPVMAILFYEAAKFLREEDIDAKLTALSYLWQATIEARTLAFMAGGLKLDRSFFGQPIQRIPIPGIPGKK